MTPTEERILSALAASRVTTSAITLAADLWRGDGSDASDPVGLCSFILADLSDRGLVTYTLRRYQRPYDNLPCRIRLTPEGWAAAGYPTIHGEVGAPSRHATPPRHPNDRTDYRTHGGTPPYSTVVTEKLEDHEAQERTHFHRHGELDDRMNALGQWRCIQCGAPMLRQGVCLVGCRRPGQ
jgi:hypothetical protein